MVKREEWLENITVECYSGYKANERPINFFIDIEKYVIDEIIDQWGGEDHTYFKVRADDQSVYILRYNLHEDKWEYRVISINKRSDLFFPDPS